MRIAEVYESIQGEGEFAGEPSVFVRTSGCNLRCWYCDTPYTSWRPEGSNRSVDELIDRVSRSTVKHVVITGGEPLIHPGVADLAARLMVEGKLITIETAGTVYQNAPCHLMSISPKLSNSTPSKELDKSWAFRHEQDRHAPEVIQRLVDEFPYQFKFVIDQESDVQEVIDYLVEFPGVSHDRVWLMPQARSQEELSEKSTWIQNQALESGFRFSSRLQIEMFGNVRGT